ncbi:hypothetical protein FRACYDRAFT_251040 [Fragilariopsis cylindrus CCMP1102]|uniref:Nucleotide-diphospho-sugar transferase n=1 Tax=Fragilariopsis cylindrus CCMP1102 TaxID=635003 RepID=A0A1E7EPB5_9STRA|nr:hypothetical protein FRACYDRAFT_251040 [Fragilariopsis cylindrus CCMP1102]|eukprot:OEU07617.1 hypothetical protein FRACYDRAFT_251040 [Fragilariopsis cylindrus CCMP1102]
MKFQFSYRTTNFKFITIIILLLFVFVFLFLSVGVQHHQLLREINNNNDYNNNIDTSFGHNSAGVVSPTPPQQLLQTIKQPPQPQPQPPGIIAIANFATDNNNEKNNNVKKKTMTTTTATMTDVVDADNDNDTGADNENAINDNDKYNTTGKYAYAMLMAGADPDNNSKLKSSSYRGILFNSMVVSELIHRNNNNSNNNTSTSTTSTSDIILMIQFAKETNATKLSDLEEEMLSRSNVKIKYIPKPSHGELNFYTVQLEKFRILQYYQEYSRILFIDGDVMPHCNLDYLFKLSEEEEQGSDSSSNSSPNTLLKENIIISGKTEPSSGGFFMLTPKEGDYEQLQEIVTNQQRTALHTGILFDPVMGWGHIITTPDSVLITTTSTTTPPPPPPPPTTTTTNATAGATATTATQQHIIVHAMNNKNNCDCLTKTERSNSNAFLGTSSRDKQLGNYLPYGNFVHFSGREKPWSTWNQDKLNIKDIIHRVEQQKNKKKNRGDGEDEDEDEDEDNGDDNGADSYYYNPMGFKNPHEIWQYTFWKIFNSKLLPVLLKTTEDNSTSHNTNTNTKPTNKDVVLVSKSEREREEERRFQIFHKLLNTIPKPIYGGYPTHWHVQLVIEAKFNQTFIPAILDTNAALQVETKRIIEKEKRQKKLIHRVRKKKKKEEEEEEEAVTKRH